MFSFLPSLLNVSAPRTDYRTVRESFEIFDKLTEVSDYFKIKSL